MGSLLIVNPAARRADVLLAAATRAFAALGHPVTVRRTTEPGDAGRTAAAEGRDHDAVFVLGGDGTTMDVVNALAHSGVAVGVLPGGTGNLVAHALAVPRRMPAAVRTLLLGARATVDLGRLDGGWRFAFAAGVGIDARMIQDTSATRKKRLGVHAYALAVGRAMLAGGRFRARVEVDGGLIEREAAGVMVANFGTVLDGLLTLGPGIRQDDGRLDLCMFSPRDRWEALEVAWRLFRADFSPHPALLYRPGTFFRIECDPPQRFQADGELLGTTPFTTAVDPRAVRLLVPRPATSGPDPCRPSPRRSGGRLADAASIK